MSVKACVLKRLLLQQIFYKKKTIILLLITPFCGKLPSAESLPTYYQYWYIQIQTRHLREHANLYVYRTVQNEINSWDYSVISPFITFDLNHFKCHIFLLLPFIGQCSLSTRKICDIYTARCFVIHQYQQLTSIVLQFQKTFILLHLLLFLNQC